MRARSVHEVLYTIHELNPSKMPLAEHAELMLVAFLGLYYTLLYMRSTTTKEPHHPRTRPAENAAVKVVEPFILAHATALLHLHCF